MNKYYKASLVVLLIAVILLVWDGCSKSAQLSVFKENVKKLNYQSELFKETIGKNKKRIAEQKQIILSQADAIDMGLLMINDMRKVKSQLRLVTKTKIDSVFIPYDKIDTQFLNTPCAFSERKLRLSDEYFSFYAVSKENGLLVDSLWFNNESTITIGNKSRGFFRKSEPIVKVEYSNPYVSTSSMQNVVIKNELKWYDKKGVWFGIGAFLGLAGGIFLIN
jgi:uncharacterized protein YcfL